MDVLSTASGMLCASSAEGTLDGVVAAAAVVDPGFGAALTGFGAGCAAMLGDCAGAEELAVVAGAAEGWLDRPCK